jgi:hypothetical protein
MTRTREIVKPDAVSRHHHDCHCLFGHQSVPPPNGLRVSGERSEAKRVRCTRMLGGPHLVA